ncbi:MAG: glycosyltransferase family 4 protein [Thermoplasmata archaeon]|nr:glycosyltransferase family 4 protein [Thermoplasmata archaeon]
MRICVVVSRDFLDPLDPRVYKEAHSLVKRGHQVVIVTPNSRPGRVMLGGIKVMKIPNTMSSLRMRTAMIKAAVKTKPDLFYCHEYMALHIGALLRVLTGKPVIYDAHEHYPSYILGGPRFSQNRCRPFLEFIIACTEYLSTRLVNETVTVNSTLAERFRHKFRKRCTILYNGPDEKMFSPHNTDDNIEHRYEGREVVVYEGSMREGRGLDVFANAFPLVREKRPQVLFLMVGRRPEALPDGAEDLRFTGWVEMNRVPHYINASHVGVVLFQPTSYNNTIGLPNKLFETMACGKPMIASDLPEIRRVVKKVRCGLLVPHSNPERLARAIIRILENPEQAQAMGARGGKAVEGKYGWAIQEKKLWHMVESYAPCRPRSSSRM